MGQSLELDGVVCDRCDWETYGTQSTAAGFIGLIIRKLRTTNAWFKHVIYRRRLWRSGVSQVIRDLEALTGIKKTELTKPFHTIEMEDVFFLHSLPGVYIYSTQATRSLSLLFGSSSAWFNSRCHAERVDSVERDRKCVLREKYAINNLEPMPLIFVRLLIYSHYKKTV